MRRQERHNCRQRIISGGRVEITVEERTGCQAHLAVSGEGDFKTARPTIVSFSSAKAARSGNFCDYVDMQKARSFLFS